MLIVFLMTAVAVTAVGVLTLGVKLRSVAKEKMVPERLDTIRRALQQYYLSHHDLPDPATTTPPNTIPVTALNLPQEYRFDSSGQFIHYDCIIDPPPVEIANIRGLTVFGSSLPEYAAVLVAPGPDKQIHPDNLSDPYADPAVPTDDVVVAVSLQAEAIKIASKAVTILQAAARAYDGQYNNPNDNPGDSNPEYDQPFDNANNDGSYGYSRIRGIGTGPDGIFGTADDVLPMDTGPDGILGSSDDVPIIDPGLNGTLGDADDEPSPLRPGTDGIYFTADDFLQLNLVVPITVNNEIDESGYVAAAGGGALSSGCVRVGQLTNDPDRGNASLDGCATAVEDIVDVFGLSERYITDPWGNAYQWGTAADYPPSFSHNIPEAEDDDRDRQYWTFFSMGPDESPNTDDDITSTRDRIPGYWGNEEPP